jgi:hypothetical protein
LLKFYSFGRLFCKRIDGNALGLDKVLQFD